MTSHWMVTVSSTTRHKISRKLMSRVWRILLTNELKLIIMMCPVLQHKINVGPLLQLTDEIQCCAQGSYGQGKSGKTERVREKSGNFKILLTRPIIYALFSQFLSASGGFAQTPTGAPPCKHCRLVYIAIFYNGTKFSITFVYLVLFYWCRE